MSQEEKQTKIEELTVPVAGMTCAACVRTIEKALRGLPGVKEASVSLAAGKAAVRVDPGACTLPDIERAIEDVGYEVPWARLELLVLGMMGAHCEENIIGGAERRCPASSPSAPPRRRTRVVVEYSEALVARGEIKQTVRELGYEVSEKGQGEDSLDRERRLRQARDPAAGPQHAVRLAAGRPRDAGHLPRLLERPGERPARVHGREVLPLRADHADRRRSRAAVLRQLLERPAPRRHRHEPALRHRHRRRLRHRRHQYLLARTPASAARRPPSTRRPRCSPASSSSAATWRRSPAAAPRRRSAS